MTKSHIRCLRKQDMRKLSKKWLFLIASKQNQFGNASIRAKEVLAELGIKVR